MQVYRLAKKSYAKLSGKGAEMFGGRWNSKGVPMIYTSDSRSLSMLEKYVHLPSGILPNDLVMISINIPDDVSIEILKVKQLPVNWKDTAGMILTRKFGDAFIALKSSCVLKVPSAIVPGDYNYLINPSHPDFVKISIVESVDFPLDERVSR